MENVVIDAAFWKGRRVLLTGHTGFKGGWLCLWLQWLGAKVTGVSLSPQTAPNFFAQSDVARNMACETGDIRDYEWLKNIFQRTQPEIVFHLAAQPLVLDSYRDPVSTYSTNVLGTVHVLEACRNTQSVRSIVNVTSDKCYENREWHWGYRECDRLGGHDPYSSSKACAELVTSAWLRSWFKESGAVGLCSVRAGNVIGGGDWSNERLIPDIIRGCIANKKIHLRQPHAFRPWQHVLEPLKGYLLLARGLYEGQTELSGSWNFGPAESDVQSVEWITCKILQLWGSNAGWLAVEKNNQHEARYLRLDCAKARSVLGWMPKWSLAESLEKTVDWYKHSLQGQQMHGFSLQQITDYMYWSSQSEKSLLVSSASECVT